LRHGYLPYSVIFDIDKALPLAGDFGGIRQAIKKPKLSGSTMRCNRFNTKKKKIIKLYMPVLPETPLGIYLSLSIANHYYNVPVSVNYPK